MRALLFALLFATFGWTQSVPKNVKALWADFDPRKDPLDVKIVREWKQDKIVYRSVTFHIGTFKGKKSRMAAF